MSTKKGSELSRILIKNTRLLLWSLLVIALFISILAMRAGIEKSLKQILLSRQEIILVQTTLDAFSDLKTQKQLAEAYKEKMSVLFPAREGLLRAVAYLEDRAGFYRLTPFFIFGAEVEDSPQDPTHVGFNLSLTGGLSEMVRYLAEIETSQYLVAFSGFEIANRGKNFQINTVGRMYIQPHATSTE